MADGHRSREGSRAALIALIVVAALGFAAAVIADWPGHFPPDGLTQLAQGRAGVFNAWHPPVLAWLLGVADRIIPGAPLIIVVQALLFFAGVAGLAAAARPGWGAAAMTGLIAASPIVLVYQGLVVKDVLFADVALFGFAALALATRAWERRLARGVLIALALAGFILAVLARQNGVLAAGAGVLCLAAVAAAKARTGPTIRRFVIVTVASAAVVGIGVASAGAWFTAHGDHRPERARQWSVLALFDLAGAARRDPTLPLPLLHARDPALEDFVRRDAARAYDPDRVDTLAGTARWGRYMLKPNPLLDAQWRAMLTASPVAYLAARTEVFGRMFAPADEEDCAPVLVGVDPANPALLRAAGLAARETDKDDWDADYEDQAVHSPIFSHPAYALIALVLLAWAGWDLRRRGRPEMIATVGLLASALAFTASFTVISLGCDFRYLYFLDVAAMAALVQRAGRVRPPRRSPRPG
ncbi:MAG TPA: hypothetical protein VGH15_04455 [Caulobacteraceae bacterium]|jgi:hypothetical protein